MYNEDMGNVLKKIQNIINTEINLIEQSGYIINSTNVDKIGEYDLNIKNLKSRNSYNNILSIGFYSYYLNNGVNSDIIVSVKSTEKEIQKQLQIIGLFLTEQNKDNYKEQSIKDILTGKINENETKVLCDKLDLPYENKFQVITVEIQEDITEDFKYFIKNSFENELFVKISNCVFAIILKDEENNDDIINSIYDGLFTELLVESKIGVGLEVENMHMLSLSYEKAIKALEVGKLFMRKKHIYYYKDLSLPILISNMDRHELDDIRYIMNNNVDKILKDDELVLTASKFFENNLNISETAKNLFIHRNTLIYRLNKIHKITGLDLRIFEHAINFKIVMLVNEYLKYRS